jgi:hypothetical protein
VFNSNVFINGLATFFDQSSSQERLILRLFAASAVALLVALFINHFITGLFSKIAELVTKFGETKAQTDRVLQIRRTETLLSVVAAALRIIVFGACLYIAWRTVNPTKAPIALIGASTFFIVLGAATIGPLFRDMTSGVLMIVEEWYNVGDYIVVDPFIDMSGVVEKINLRSTKLRMISGEIVWIHNQYIQAVRMTPRGVRTISVDTFVNNLDGGRKLIAHVLESMPTGPTMIASPLVIKEEEHLGTVWRITAEGQTAPGREWLIEDFVVKALINADKTNKADNIIAYGPIVRYTDPTAERRFERSMQRKTPRTTKQSSK